jgi:hypothetical protein
MANSTSETVEALEKQAEKVKLTLEVPVGMAEFFNDLGDIPLGIESGTLKGFAEHAVLTQFECLLDGLPWTMFNMEQIHKIYGLREFAQKKEALQPA